MTAGRRKRIKEEDGAEEVAEEEDGAEETVEEEDGGGGRVGQVRVR